MATDIVVGVDGSRCGSAALRWATAEASRRGARLRVVYAYETPRLSGQLGAQSELERAAREHANELVSAAAAEARDLAPELAVTTATGLESPAKVLLEAADTAAMVVIGNRGRGGFASLVLGSTCQQVATHAPSLAVVVRGRGATAAGPVVVGCDGSKPSEYALSVAFSQAASRGCGLVAIRTFAVPAPIWGMDVPPSAFDTEEIKRLEEAELDRSLEPLIERYPSVPVESSVLPGLASRALTTAAESGQLLVVGASGHAGLAGTLLGSVVLYVLHHADCPVLVARPPVNQ